ILPQQASGYQECASAGMAATSAATISNAANGQAAAPPSSSPFHSITSSAAGEHNLSVRSAYDDLTNLDLWRDICVVGNVAQDLRAMGADPVVEIGGGIEVQVTGGHERCRGPWAATC